MQPLMQRISYAFFRKFPAIFWRRYKYKALESGFKTLYAVLSFDCDTDEDILASSEIDLWLRERGINPTYAVPGIQLERGSLIYKSLAARGSEFINHGYLPHAKWIGDRYISTTFYDQMTTHEVERDIRLGHECVSKIIGKSPIGFRAPHFGHFQGRKHLKLQYKILRSLGYLYSTSTTPICSFKYGPVGTLNNLFELPLSGIFSSPANILDSWSYIADPTDSQISEDYGRLLIESVSSMKKFGLVGILNMYVDPSHVIKNQTFKNAILQILDMGVEFIDYSRAIEIASSKRILPK